MYRFIENYYKIALRAQENNGGGLGAAIVIYLGLSWFLTTLLNLLKYIDFLVPIVILFQMIVVIYCGLGVIISLLVYFNIIKPEQTKKIRKGRKCK
ncbi:MAG: hypothetical protein ACI4U3_04685 [Traorella sp.]